VNYRGLELDPFQVQAIDALREGRSVLVAAPTGTGKTIIADWIVEEALEQGKQVIYTAPIKALSNQKFRDYTRLYGDRVGLVTGDLVIRRDAPCLVMTTEILRNILLAGESVLDLHAVIVDEIHFLDDRERGTVWEELLIYLPTTVQIVGLSATLSNLDEFSSWLGQVRGAPLEVVVEKVRSVPLSFRYLSVETGLVTPEQYEVQWKRKGRGKEPAVRGRHKRDRFKGRGRDRKERRPRRKTGHIDVFRVLEEEDLLPYLYFVFSRRDTEICARALGRQIKHRLVSEEDQRRLDTLLDRAAADLGPALDQELRSLYRRGIAFHHAGLHVSLKALVEELYEARLIKVLYCTSTFALGINMPARTVVFDGLKKYDGRAMTPLRTRQFMQKAGRAGRRGMDDEGHVIIRMDLSEFEMYKPHLARYAKGETEPVRSSFSLSWNSIVNLLESYEPERIRTIVDKSFLNWNLAKQAERHLKRAEDLSEDRRNRRSQKEAHRLRRRAARAEDRCWLEFEEKVSYLQGIGYLGEDPSTFNAGAKALKHVQISEMLVCEMFLQGIFENLEPSQLFGVLCSVTNELPRKVQTNFRSRGDDRALARLIKQIRHSDPVLDAEEMTGLQYDFDPNLITLGRAWADGDSLQDILMMIHSETDVSGDLITGFRRAKDLAGQLRDVYQDLPDRVEMLKTLIRTVRRDEVEVVD
jgi:ATP-dependent RNA helicase HelY